MRRVPCGATLIAMGILAVACLTQTQAAAANSGAITNVRAVGNGQLQATFQSTSTQCDNGACAWYPYAVEVPPGASCVPGLSEVIYVGNVQEQPSSQVATQAFFVENSPATLCLLISGPRGEQPVAQTTYTPVFRVAVRVRGRQRLRRPTLASRTNNLRYRVRCTHDLNVACRVRVRGYATFVRRGRRRRLRQSGFTRSHTQSAGESAAYGLYLGRRTRRRLTRVMRRHGSLVWRLRFVVTAADGLTESVTKRIRMPRPLRPRR
jgi:hypothetical protein